jgi:hypothetical protein
VGLSGTHSKPSIIQKILTEPRIEPGTSVLDQRCGRHRYTQKDIDVEFKEIIWEEDLIHLAQGNEHRIMNVHFRRTSRIFVTQWAVLGFSTRLHLNCVTEC